MKINTTQVSKWVKAFALFAAAEKIKPNTNKYIQMEHQMVSCFAAAELGVPVADVPADQLPPIVTLCFQSFRPLASVLLTKEGELKPLVNEKPALSVDEAILARCDESVRPRVSIELRIVRELIRRLREAGYNELSVDDGDGEKQSVSRSSFLVDDDDDKLVDIIFGVDEAKLYANSYCILLVMGNDGTDIVSDYHIGLDLVMTGLDAWIEKGGYHSAS